MIRIGNGFDVHAFCADRPLILGGVQVPYHKGLLGFSDADVLIHALCDACLGAASLGDIGQHFPDSNPEYKNADSRMLLRRVVHLLEQDQWRVSNADITVIAQAPKLAPHIEAMRNNLARDLELEISALNIKATTTEGLGFTGREEGIAAMASVLITRD